MPLVTITLAQGRSPEYRRALADGVHAALVETADVSADDRFQVLHEVSAGDLIWDPRYLGLQRTEAIVFVQIFFNRGRSVEVKRALYARITDKLAASPGVRKDDVLISLVEVSRENWSFGGGYMSYPPAP